MDEQMQQQIVALVQAAMQGDQQATQQIQQIMQAAQQGDQQAAQLAQMIQQVAQAMQLQQAQAYRKGGMINYVRALRGKCPVGYEMGYFKNGGRAGCVKCQDGRSVDQFKCGKKMKKGQKGISFTDRIKHDLNRAKEWGEDKFRKASDAFEDRTGVSLNPLENIEKIKRIGFPRSPKFRPIIRTQYPNLLPEITVTPEGAYPTNINYTMPTPSWILDHPIIMR